MKSRKYAASLIIRNDDGEFLVVKRPDDPRDEIAGVWGFPAASARDESEDEVTTAHRVATDKLGVKVELGRRIGESTHERRAVVLTLVDYEARIVSGTPSVPQSDASITQYVELMYTKDPTVVIEAARRGSQCTQIFLDDAGVTWASE
jgi:8-oxo-dGTP diphosphatase